MLIKEWHPFKKVSTTLHVTQDTVSIYLFSFLFAANNTRDETNTFHQDNKSSPFCTQFPLPCLIMRIFVTLKAIFMVQKDYFFHTLFYRTSF